MDPGESGSLQGPCGLSSDLLLGLAEGLGKIILILSSSSPPLPHPM